MENAEVVQLFFQPGDRRKEGFRLASSYKGLLVGLCQQYFCELCDLPKRKQLRGFRGGRLKVQLTLHRRPSFLEERQFYLAHLQEILPQEPQVTDEGLEADFSRLNAVLYRTAGGAIIVDPGSMGFEGGALSLNRIIERENVATTIITHGHVDHWSHLGGVKGEAFMSSLAFRLASRHAHWQGDDSLIAVLRGTSMVTPGEPILVELPLKIDTFPLPHSIPETVGLVIKGKRARVVHLGDFKFNGMSPRSKAQLIGRLMEIARESVDVLALNILNAHIEGFTPIEALVIDAMTDIMARAQARVIVTCFSTNLERIRRIVEVAQCLGRPVRFLGAGMQNCQELLEVETGEGDLDKAVVFVTGCQAEEESVLWRLSQGRGSCLAYQNGEMVNFSLQNNDTVVFSSRCIPGNEKPLSWLYRKIKPMVGRLVVTKEEAETLRLEGVGEAFTHVSGHESKEGVRLALEILKPKRVLPWPQISPQMEAFTEITAELPFRLEIINEEERVIEI